MKTPYDKLAKTFDKDGHHAHIWLKPLKIVFSRTRRPVTLGLSMYYWGCGTYQVRLNDDTKLTLTYNLLPNAFKREVIILA